MSAAISKSSISARATDDIIPLKDKPGYFIAQLGVMSLSGMLIKNAIVLIAQIDLELREGKERFQAVVDSGVNRMMPVCMAALTTIMGTIPLL
jgi:multidrug efflux pump subunit AcrB